MGKIKVGVLGSSDINSFFKNGLYQNAWSLAKMLKDSGEFDVTLICQKTENPKKTLSIPTAPTDIDGIALKKNGTKIIQVKYGNNLCADIDTFVSYSMGQNTDYARNEWYRTLYSYEPDLVLLAPQFEYQRQYVAITSGLPEEKVVTTPYIWDSFFMKAYSKIYRQQIGEEYDLTYKVGDERNKRIVCAEPGISFIKNNLMPIIVANEVYKKDPNLIDKGYAFNSSRLLLNKDARHYLSLLSKLEVFRNNVISLEKRLPMIDIMAKKGRVLLSHQILNSLNYTYFEFAFFGYPFVHNSDILSHYGYYYEGNKLLDAKEKLVEALSHESLSEKERLIYKNSCQEMVWAYSPSNPKNISKYTELIKSVV